MLVVHGIDGLKELAGQELGVSEWLEVDQDRIQLFADATGDHQWIHVDPVRAAAGPFGKTIAHGYMSLSLLPAMAEQIYRVDGLKMTVNYGLDKVRFPTPVPVGSRLRSRLELLDVTPSDQGVRAFVKHTMELEGSSRPACVAEQIRFMVDREGSLS
jgi:acyl dehydratase